MNIQLTTEQREAIAGSYEIMARAYSGVDPYPVLIPDPEYGEAGSMQVWWCIPNDCYLYIGPDGGDARIEAILPGTWS